MARTPLILWLIKEAGEAEESIPGNRGELYRRFVSRMLRRDTQRRMDAGIPERLKRQALADIAYHLGQGKRLVCPREDAVAVVAKRLDGDVRLAEDVIGACARHGLLAGEQDLWFVPHQTVQEHFAALALREIARREWALSPWQQWMRRIVRRLTGRADGLLVLASDDWWMETFVQLAGLVDDTDRLVREIVRVNPWLAWWCVGEGRDVSEETREAVEDRSIRLLSSKRVTDRRRAVAALAQIRNVRTVEPLFRSAGDEDEEVAGLAVQALVEMGGVPKGFVRTWLKGTNERLRLAVLRYLLALPDKSFSRKSLNEVLGHSVVWIPPGPFLMGSDRQQDAQAYGGESPRHEVNLSGYWIGRYPVTVAQFRIFVEESGYEVDTHSVDDPDDHPVRYVSWDDARAYCHWLSGKTGLAVRLPSEAEWEKAARGTDGRIYPWGDEAPTDNLCNFNNRDRGTSPVGRYSPQGDSPYECVDMAGNVWEWTRSLYERYPYDPADGRENWEADGHRVLRGGAFLNNSMLVRCASRNWFKPRSRYGFFGFRVCIMSQQE
jgi:formylglycine-generating enzyme required for sulfatase activity